MSYALSGVERDSDCSIFIDDMCVVFIFNFVFSVIVGLYVDIIYLHCQAPPSMFCSRRYKNSDY